MKYSSLIELLQHFKVPEFTYLKQGKNCQYTSSDVFEDMLNCLETQIKDRLITDLRNSPVVGLGIDESSDRTMDKQCAWVIRYIKFCDDGTVKVVTTFLSMKVMKSCRAEDLLQKTLTVLDEYGVALGKVNTATF